MNTKTKLSKKTLCIAIICLIIAVLAGVGFLLRDPLAQDARQIARIITKHNQEHSSSDTLPGVITTFELSALMEKHRDTLALPYTHDESVSQSFASANDRQIHQLIANANPAWDTLFWYASREGCQYLAYPTLNGYTLQADAFGYEKIGTSAHFNIYYHPTADLAETCLITQYGDPKGNQQMFYTLEPYQGGLIVVDGGWNADAHYVREILANLGNHITAWILTHPHSDHIGAFCEIYPTPGDLTIDKVYTVDMATPQLCLQNASWDDIGTYERFLTLNVEQLTYLYAGDSLEIGGLDFYILSAYEDYVDTISNDLLNDGSMVFKVTAKNNSMLFCADVGINMTDHLLITAGEHLKSDYLQIAHHGNGGLADYFYREVAPKVTFFDAPNWLMEDAENRFTTPENKQLMLDIGSEVYSFSTAPNQFILE